MRDSAAKLIDALVLMRHAAQRGFTVLGGRMAALGPLARALGVHGTDAGLGESESFLYASKVKNHEPRAEGSSRPAVLGGRVYLPQLGRSVSAAEWSRLMTVPSLRGQLLCRLPCCGFGQPIETTPSRGREHSLHSRVSEARQYSGVGSTAIGQVVRLLEQRQSAARAVTNALAAAGLPPLSTEHAENHLAAASFFADALSDVA